MAQPSQSSPSVSAPSSGPPGAAGLALLALLALCPAAQGQPVDCRRLDPNLEYSARLKRCVCRAGYRAHERGPVLRCCKPGHVLRGKECARVHPAARCGAAQRGMVCVPRGAFYRGSAADIGQADERPDRRIKLEAFLIDRHEVSVAQYQRCVRAGACDTAGLSGSKALYGIELCNWGRPDRADHPLNCVSWTQAERFCRWTGKRLPTEAEWEKAARGTRDRRQFPWGNDAPTCQQANLAGCSRGTLPVSALARGASVYGAQQLVGNVAEWVQDWYGPRFYGQGPAKNPVNTTPSALGHVRRGGYYHSGADLARLSHRGMPLPPSPWGYGVGLRCARSAGR